MSAQPVRIDLAIMLDTLSAPNRVLQSFVYIGRLIEYLDEMEEDEPEFLDDFDVGSLSDWLWDDLP